MLGLSRPGLGRAGRGRDQRRRPTVLMSKLRVFVPRGGRTDRTSRRPGRATRSSGRFIPRPCPTPWTPHSAHWWNRAETRCGLPGHQGRVGGRVLVLGQGTIGLLVAMFPRAAGAEVHRMGDTDGSVRGEPIRIRQSPTPGIRLPALQGIAAYCAATSTRIRPHTFMCL